MKAKIGMLLALTAAFALACASPTTAQGVPQTILWADFGKLSPEQVMDTSGVAPSSVTSDPSEEVDGSPSLTADSRADSNQWNEFFHSKIGLFRPKVAYKVSFDYKILAANPAAKYYALFRRTGANSWVSDQFTYFSGTPGETRHAALSFYPNDAADFYLIIGIQNQGAIAINNLVVQTDPDNTPPDISLPRPTRTWNAPPRTTYYLDSAAGSDSNDGTTPAHAWKTLERVNSGTFAAGDKILLRSGCRWTGVLCPGGSGTAGAPIVIDRYGAGPKPEIDGNETALATIYLHNVEYIEMRDLAVTNSGHIPVPKLAGVQVHLDNFGTAHHILLAGLDIHNISGSDDKSLGGGNGIFIDRSEGGAPSRYDGLRIQDCHLVHTDRNGITMDGYPSRSHWYPNLHVVISHNLLEDIGGDGIVPIGCDGARVEYNTIRGGRMRAQDYAAGIWPWSCDNTVIQYNDVSGMRGDKDAEGYDSDFNCKNSLFQYNFSHDNQGGFMLICCDGDFKPDFSAGNVGTVIRYNISVDDGLHTFNINGPCTNTSIYNNVFYIGKGGHMNAISSGNWGGTWPSDTRFKNNIFYVAAGGEATFDLGQMAGTVFDHNAFYGSLVNRPLDDHAFTGNPGLIAPGSDRPAGYALRANSPCRHAGVPIPNDAAHDFFGNPVSPGTARIGAGTAPGRSGPARREAKRPQ